MLFTSSQVELGAITRYNATSCQSDDPKTWLTTAKLVLKRAVESKAAGGWTLLCGPEGPKAMFGRDSLALHHPLYSSIRAVSGTTHPSSAGRTHAPLTDGKSKPGLDSSLLAFREELTRLVSLSFQRSQEQGTQQHLKPHDGYLQLAADSSPSPGRHVKPTLLWDHRATSCSGWRIPPPQVPQRVRTLSTTYGVTVRETGSEPRGCDCDEPSTESPQPALEGAGTFGTDVPHVPSTFDSSPSSSSSSSSPSDVADHKREEEKVEPALGLVPFLWLLSAEKLEVLASAASGASCLCSLTAPQQAIEPATPGGLTLLLLLRPSVSHKLHSFLRTGGGLRPVEASGSHRADRAHPAALLSSVLQPSGRALASGPISARRRHSGARQSEGQKRRRERRAAKRAAAAAAAAAQTAAVAPAQKEQSAEHAGAVLRPESPSQPKEPSPGLLPPAEAARPSAGPLQAQTLSAGLPPPPEPNSYAAPAVRVVHLCVARWLPGEAPQEALARLQKTLRHRPEPPPPPPSDDDQNLPELVLSQPLEVSRDRAVALCGLRVCYKAQQTADRHLLCANGKKAALLLSQCTVSPAAEASGAAAFSGGCLIVVGSKIQGPPSSPKPFKLRRREAAEDVSSGRRKSNNPRQRCVMVGGASSALLVQTECLGSGGPGVEVTGGSMLVLKDSRIAGAGRAGLFVQKGSTGIVTGSEVCSSSWANAEVRGAGSLLYAGSSTFHSGQRGGLLVLDAGAAWLHSVHLKGHKLAHVDVRDHSTAVLRDVAFRKGAGHGLFVHQRARAWLLSAMELLPLAKQSRKKATKANQDANGRNVRVEGSGHAEVLLTPPAWRKAMADQS